MWCKSVYADAATVTKKTDYTLSARAFPRARCTEVTCYATVKSSYGLKSKEFAYSSVGEWI